MKNVVVLAVYKDIDYALIARVDPETKKAWEFVAAWAPEVDDPNDIHWGQGHYYRDFEDAVEHIKDVQKFGSEGKWTRANW